MNQLTTSTNKRQKKPFLITQGVGLLTDFSSPLQHLSLTAMRNRRGSVAGGSPAPDVAAELDPWSPIDRDGLVRSWASYQIPSGQTDNPAKILEEAATEQTISLHRFVLTTDAGIGKTTNMKWLRAEINRRSRHNQLSNLQGNPVQPIAFLIYLDQLQASGENFIRDYLVKEIARLKKYEWMKNELDRGESQIRRMRDRGELVLLFDGLDQTKNSAVIETLKYLLESQTWKPCRIIVSGRPHSIRRHWKELFEPRLNEVRFVELDEFEERQQKLFLGETNDGRSRWDLISEDAREILTVPRVLEYILEVPDGKLHELKSASHVYWHAIEKMIAEGLKDNLARSIGLKKGEISEQRADNSTKRLARKLLAAIAFEMTATTEEESSEIGPNFSMIGPGQFENFAEKVYTRVKSPTYESDRSYSDFEADLDRLSAMNDFLQRAIFDVEQVTGLDQVLWRNRSLQEFLTALWIAKFCREEDKQRLWDWIYHDDDPVSEEYYWIWSFAIEMPKVEARSRAEWTRAMSVLYETGSDQIQKYNDANTDSPIVKRPCELIYRTWHELEKISPPIIKTFQSEFEQILNGSGGRAQTAREFTEQFQEIPDGSFKMGSPPEKQGVTPNIKKRAENFLKNYAADPDEGVDEIMKTRSYPIGKSGDAQKSADQTWFRSVIEQQDTDRLISWLYPSNETPAVQEHSIKSPFNLCRYPTLNEWLWLFKPEHGKRRPDYLNRISDDPQKPAIYVNYFVAWVFAKWVFWDQRCCRLPTEVEWEYACKANTRWDQGYWWDDEFDLKRCTADQSAQSGSTTRPCEFDLETEDSASHRNPFGMVDMNGNVWEWCSDVYVEKYVLVDLKEPDFSVRVLRGGSWSSLPRVARSAFRDRLRPSGSDDNTGFRVVRAT